MGAAAEDYGFYAAGWRGEGWAAWTMEVSLLGMIEAEGWDFDGCRFGRGAAIAGEMSRI